MKMCLDYHYKLLGIKYYIFFFFILCFVTVTGCTGIKLENNCVKNEKIIISVLPFTNDNYNCTPKIENILQEMCYEMKDGRSLLEEFSNTTGKDIYSSSIDELIEFAAAEGINKIIVGIVSVEWVEGSMRGGGVILDQNDTLYKSDMDSYRAITGNYAIVDCYSIDTKNKEKNEIFHKYKVKKIPLGLPDIIRSNNN